MADEKWTKIEPDEIRFVFIHEDDSTNELIEQCEYKEDKIYLTLTDLLEGRGEYVSCKYCEADYYFEQAERMV
jgi:hypothetical protein